MLYFAACIYFFSEVKCVCRSNEAFCGCEQFMQLKYIIFCIQWNGSDVYFRSKQVRNNWTYKSQKRGFVKQKYECCNCFILQIRGHCVDLRKHIELRFWSVGLPFGEMFLALVVPYFTMKWYVKRLSTRIKSLMRYPQKRTISKTRKISTQRLRSKDFCVFFLIGMSSIPRSFLLA